MPRVSNQPQTLQLQVGEDVLVAQERAGAMLVEPHLAAHSSDPMHLLAVAWVFPEGENREDRSIEHCATFFSSDGGRTWTRRDLAVVSCADPWISLTDRGAVLTALATHTSLPDSDTQLLVSYSSTGGRSWDDVPHSLGRNHDGPRTIVAPNGTVYVVSGQAWRDESKKLRFTVPVGRARPGRPRLQIINRLVPSNLNLNSDGLAVLSDGALVVTYDDFGRKVDGRWTPAGALKSRRSWAVISQDDGETFSIPLFISESCSNRPTSLAADTSSGPFKDRLYHVCATNDARSIAVTYSADRGEEWSSGTSIDGLAHHAGARRDPQVAVNRLGVVAVAWMDRRDDPSDRCYAPYVSVSADGARTFSTPVRVASHVSCPDATRTGFAGRRWPTGGDYFGLAAGADGRFHVLWPDARQGTFAVRAAAISVNLPSKE